MSPRPSRAVRERLEGILDAVDRTKRAEARLVHAESGDDADGTRVAIDAILYNLVVIGEAVNALSASVTEAEPSVPWHDIVDMRNSASSLTLSGALQDQHLIKINNKGKFVLTEVERRERQEGKRA